MIEIRRIDNLNCPMVICDFCSEPILSDGNVLWNPDSDRAPVMFAHKRCDRQRGKTFWMGLPDFLVRIVNNSRTDWKKAVKRVERWGEWA